MKCSAMPPYFELPERHARALKFEADSFRAASFHVNIK